MLCTFSLCFVLISIVELLFLFVFGSSVCWYCSSFVFVHLSSHRLLSFLSFSFLPLADSLQYLVSRVVVLYSPVTLVPSFSYLMSAQWALTERHTMLGNEAWRLCSVCVWSVSVPLDNIFWSFAGPDMSDYALHWNFSTNAVTIFVGSVWMLTIGCVWHAINPVRQIFISVVFRT